MSLAQHVAHQAYRATTRCCARARTRGLGLTFEDVPNPSLDFNEDFRRFVEHLPLTGSHENAALEAERAALCTNLPRVARVQRLGKPRGPGLDVVIDENHRNTVASGFGDCRVPLGKCLRSSVARPSVFRHSVQPSGLCRSTVRMEASGFTDMAESWQITCIKKSNRPNPYERIERAGGPEGEGWALFVDQIIAYIRKGGSFWVDIGGRRVDIVIASHSGHEYIKTTADDDHPENLLRLPECY